MAVLEFDRVDVIFGRKSKEALALLDQGLGRDEIFDRTGAIVAVHAASLFADQGDTLVLMGLSGSGKSSLLRCVNGLNRISRGHLYLREEERSVDLADCTETDLLRLRRARIAMVFQQFALMPWLNVRENVAFGLAARGMDKHARGRLVEEKLAQVRLERWADKFPHELSGGMQQRVGLARALATEAEILLMDEPFSALDPLIREHLQDEMLDLQARLKKTIIFVSHDLNEALKLGTRIAIMEAGRVVQFAPPAEIVLRPTNDYVRQFVASMNPLTVLRGAMLMRPVMELPRRGGDIELDGRGARCTLDPSGKPVACYIGERTTQFLMAPPEIPMRQAVQHYEHNGEPILICGPDGALQGVITEAELYRGLLRSGTGGAAARLEPAR
ncbi:MAG TPA: ATP-binding cassette domain-containing protein [Dongiaceae bacterium]|jgi:glycine betaine/proline transport system ATP-binding protein|nr:ATP-binding cassette domain-containing protein [Dongiaceae bacterium]